MKTSAISLCFVLFWFLGVAHAGMSPQPRVWTVDPLEKVFRDATPSVGSHARAEVARGECASFQVVVRCDESMTGLRAKIAPFKRRLGRSQIAGGTLRFVGYVPVDRPTQKPSGDQLRQPPADFPDPLLEVPSMDVDAAAAQPLWVSVQVPVDARPGLYHADVRITCEVGGREVELKQRLAMRVYDAVIERSRLWVTDWFAMQWRHMSANPQPESDEYYALLRRYARNMAEHRHNVALISAIGLADYGAGQDGRLTINFSRFDRWVDIFREEGVIGLIEGGHIGGRKGGWDSEFVVQVRKVQDGKVVSSMADPDSPEADEFYAQFFTALVEHLREKHWLDCYVQHLADEPIEGNIESYRAMAALARKYAPDLRIIEACHAKDLTGAMDIWVPQLNYLHDDYSHYAERQKQGDEVWFYTCVFPQGEYANRFIEQPLMKTRLLHWINFRYGITGYLHWGYNHWTDDSPFTHTTRPHGGPPYLPAGDPWIVYPGENGPLDSIRFEAMRDGIADHELLSLLAEKDPDSASRLAARHILDFDKYETDIGQFRATRRELLKRLSKVR